jgi:hypothetical protein
MFICQQRLIDFVGERGPTPHNGQQESNSPEDWIPILRREDSGIRLQQLVEQHNLSRRTSGESPEKRDSVGIHLPRSEFGVWWCGGSTVCETFPTYSRNSEKNL